MSYKDTLNLPKTDFPMKANLSALESKILSHWQNLSIYESLRSKRKDSEKFILHDGPPYANGRIHIGHALNKILKDIILKYKVLKGFDCPFVVGWDCHGLPVEHQLFKELKLTKHDVEVTDFRKNAKEYALRFVEEQRKDFQRLGIFSDWQNPYLTLDTDYEYSVMKLLEYLVSKKYIYRGRKPVNWCSSCETALAEAEVEYNDKESDSIYLFFKLTDDPRNVLGGFKDKDISFLVWTTTPWTLVSNVAVAIHPDLEYSLIEARGKFFILCKDLMPSIEAKVDESLRIIKSFKGVDLENLALKHPFFDRRAKLVLADFVSQEEGSGCVHIAPGHGEEDFSLIKKYNLDIIMPLNDQGKFDEPQEFLGKNITEANKLVLEKLNQENLLLIHEKIQHSYPHCWRCKKPIVFRATFQWFLSVDHNNLRSKALKEIDKVNWVPSSGKERMRGMLATRPDWCISRQRLWGVPIPAIKCISCSEVFLDQAVISKTGAVFKESGSDSWFVQGLGKFIPEDFRCPNCQSKEFSKEYDILDVWFESGASFSAVVKANSDLNFPADLYLEGSDQHRGWFQVSLIPSVAKENISPFKTILTHGFVVDGEGKKMSKSLGNVIAPQNIIRRYGAEIIRFWAAYADYSDDVKISEDILKQLTDMYRKIRNTIRFVMGNISDFDIERNQLAFKDLQEVDRFMAAKTMLVFDEVMSDYENFDFYKACQKIFNFCNLDLSSFYLDILKDRLYTFSPNSGERRSAQFVLYHILKILIKLIAPILSFTAEEANLAWSNLEEKSDSIFLSLLSCDYKNEWIDRSLLKKWDKILQLRSQVLKKIESKREAAVIGSSLEAGVVLCLDGADYDAYLELESVLKEIFIVSQLSIKKGSFDILISKAEGNKCLRCWNWNDTVGSDENFSDLCLRCQSSLKEVNEHEKNNKNC